MTIILQMIRIVSMGWPLAKSMIQNEICLDGSVQKMMVLYENHIIILTLQWSCGLEFGLSD